MERRIGSRAQVDLPVGAYVDGWWHPCRAVDLSARGMVVQRTKSLSGRSISQLNELALELGGRIIGVLARTVWHDGRMLAVRFVDMSDVDRLEIAEHLDEIARRRRQLLH